MNLSKLQRAYRVALCGVMLLLGACSLQPVDRGQQYHDGKLDQPFSQVNHTDAEGKPINAGDFARQLYMIQQAAPGLYQTQSPLYQQISQWLLAGGDTRMLHTFSINGWQMQGADGYGNVLFTGYYTPVLQARTTRQGEFQYPLYGMPAKGRTLPSRQQIHAGALNKKYILAYSNSLMDNFIMGVQGSGYVDFGDGQPLVFFSYAGKNNHPYRSIGKVLIDQGEIKKQEMSMQAIRHWADTHSQSQVQQLLEKNPSFVFFKPKGNSPVRGASGVTLIEQTAIAADPAIVPAGSTLLAEIPLLDNQGRFTGKYQLRLLIALDVGGAIKGQHFDLYQGIGGQAGERAGWLNHYGRVWLLKNTR